MAVRALKACLLILGGLLWSEVHCYNTTANYAYPLSDVPQIFPRSENGYNCTFTNSLCGWNNEQTDVFDWTLNSGGTPSARTGPNSDHTTSSGRYLYIESSAPRRPGDTARIAGSFFDIQPDETMCFSFWYFMSGSSIGQLNVYTSHFGKLDKIWTLHGEQGYSWKQAVVNVTGNGSLQLVIEGVRGSSYEGDIAIDDTELSDSPCKDDEDSYKSNDNYPFDQITYTAASYDQSTAMYPWWIQQSTAIYPWWIQHSTDNSVTVRLINGPNYHSGTVEVRRNGVWGTVCDDEFDHNDVMVICRMLGLYIDSSHGRAYSDAYFGQGSGPIYLDNVRCYGHESDIGSCISNGWGSNNCGHQEDAGVDCYASPYEFTTENPWWIHQTSSSQDGSIRLVGGNYHSGRVEIYSRGQWGTVCDDSFDHNDVKVICRMLGLYYGDNYGVAYQSAQFGSGSGQIIVDDLQCHGYETDIKNCPQAQLFHSNCDHSEDAGVDCHAFAYDLTTEYPWWIHQTSSAKDGSIRLVGGNYHSGRVEIYSRGQWGTICDDSFDHNDVKVICRMLGLYYGDNYCVAYQSAQFGSGSGPIIVDDLQCHGYETDIKYCPQAQLFHSNCDHTEDAGVDCHAYSYGTTSPPYTTYPWWLTTRYYTMYSTSYPYWKTTYHGYRLQDAISVHCNEYTWNIKVDMNILRQINPNAKGSDIYLGENKCTGVERNGHLTFQQGLDDCLTSESVQYNGIHVYNNELIYAEHDPVYLFIIRHYNWTVGVECDVRTDGSVYGNINNYEVTTSSPIIPSQNYPVNISYYLDPNYMQKVSGDPLHADVGAHVYVKVFTTTTDWDVRMRVHTCYTKPTLHSPDHTKYYLIRNGCEVDSNTHIISQSTHETRFMFDQFEFTSNHEGIYVFCDTIFCRSSDWSPQCRQTCNPMVKRKISVEKIQAHDNENESP